MTFQVRIHGRDISFSCNADECILDAAERAGLSMPYSCRKGVCNTCETALIAGELEVRGRGRLAGRTPDVLICQARPCSDVEIEPKRIEKTAPPQRKYLTAAVYRVSRPATDVAILNLRFPTGTRAKFCAGQYLQIVLPDGDRRNYSMANPPHENDGVELHIRHVPGGRFSEGVLAGIAPGSKLAIELPFGQFFLRQSNAPAILLATGTGLAPIKSIIEDALRRGNDRPMRLYWGARTLNDLYMLDRIETWATRAPWFSFVPVLSEPTGNWRGRTGFVHRAVLEDHPKLTGAEVYACGNPLMIAAAQKDFGREAGLPEEHFYSDAFVPSGQLEAAA